MSDQSDLAERLETDAVWLWRREHFAMAGAMRAAAAELRSVRQREERWRHVTDALDRMVHEHDCPGCRDALNDLWERYGDLLVPGDTDEVDPNAEPIHPGDEHYYRLPAPAPSGES